ncbi:hypothetical protein [Parahaliea mediterranea]|uniref:hypothetical protein n=1 Tax=Parahaliea mediterranea TaxID=651086 RepID=UPI0013002947|nr:hypothetical protein [Parahaliea mediterranea]
MQNNKPDKELNPLDQTVMGDFVTSNKYEWPFLYFRAVLLSEHLDWSESDTHSDDKQSTEQLRFLNMYWGSITEYIRDIDYDDLTEIFEEWCANIGKHLVLPTYNSIQIADTSSTTDFNPNTIYLSATKAQSSELLQQIYKPHLDKALIAINKELDKKTLFSEIERTRNRNKLHGYEQWLDTVLLYNMNVYVDGNGHDRVRTFLDICESGKECWQSFIRRYGEQYSLLVESSTRDENGCLVLREKAKLAVKNVKTELKLPFDALDKTYASGMALLTNIEQGKFQASR